MRLASFSKSSYRTRLIVETKDNVGNVTTITTRAKVATKKVAPPFTECEFDIMIDEKNSRTGSLIDLGIRYKIFGKKTWISHERKLIVQRCQAIKQYLRKPLK
jgi:recombination protein RecA